MAVQTVHLHPEAASGPQNAVHAAAAQFWEHYLRSIMVPLFKSVGAYTLTEQQSHLKFMDEHIATNLGPLPTDPHASYIVPAAVVGSPFDPSINLTSTGNGKVRFDYTIVEPVERPEGDPFSENLARELLHRLAAVVGADTSWMDSLMSALYLSTSETDTLLTKMPTQLLCPPASVGLDFDGPKRTLKAYIPGMRKALATGRSPTELLLAAVRVRGSPEAVAVDLTSLFSERVQQWEPGAIRSLLPLESLPGMISLVAGKPYPETFPFTKISMSIKDSNETTIVLEESLLKEALQYGLPAGNAELIQWFRGLQKTVHCLRESNDWACCVGNGSQELIHRGFQVFTDLGDPVLLETHYGTRGVIGFLKADGHHLVEVISDSDGLDPSELERILLDWPEKQQRPKILYTVPTGSNPTGRSCTDLRLAKRFNVMIFEDDAYYFINFEEVPSKRARSYLALENEINGETGRVIRFDSLSKIISSGMRLGFLTGPTPAVQKVIKITEKHKPASTTQFLALSLFRHWGYPGFLSHCAEAANTYRQKRDFFEAAAERHLKGKATWDTPTAGMFFWLTLLLPPDTDSFDLLSTKSTENGILAIPSVVFMPSARKSYQLRASYSLITEVDMDEACRSVAKLVDDAWTKQSF
ncbi:hypothetical protein ACJ72_03995 [Emergomyces africanus]|uniref:Aminotransferase class I/classII large domain-containing protein n=1 Tax=Emergomyces africanus TaxID=1955775 RepID=A0A1B7NY40_9EURO|nr:hypothetical protein ACJ72_03995 [Emergomyces africanus]